MKFSNPNRISLPSSVQDFGLSASTSAPNSPAGMTFDFDEPFPSAASEVSTPQNNSTNEPASPTLRRMPRHNLLTLRTGSLGDLTSGLKMHSPLRSSFSRRSSFLERFATQEESDSERERDRARYRTRHRTSSPSSGSDLPTPPLLPDRDASVSASKPRTPTTAVTPSSATLSPASSSKDVGSNHTRRLSHSVKPPRLLSLIAEANPADSEVKSEAQFQRMLASYNGSPISRPRTGRAMSDRGRFPEEACREDEDDGRLNDTGSEEDEISSVTAAAPSAISLNILEDAPMLESFRNSPAGSLTAMDIDLTSLPQSSFASSSSSSLNTSNTSPVTWRQTPPPTAGAIRPNKRKFEDRYDPYPSQSKRRAVSPSLMSLRDTLSHVISTPIPVPVSRSPIVRTGMLTSVNSSPGGGSSFPPLGMPSSYGNHSLGHHSRPISAVSSPVASSPQHRPVTLLGSPILRPLHRLAGDNRAMERGQREIDGAGEGFGSLSLS